MTPETDWRAAHGMAPKPRRNCPVCGNESVAGRKCQYHARTEKRTEYHAAYYRANRARLAEESRQRRAAARMRARMRPIIEELKRAVDLGRESARW
jgi:hypothetical protein